MFTLLYITKYVFAFKAEMLHSIVAVHKNDIDMMVNLLLAWKERVIGGGWDVTHSTLQNWNTLSPSPQSINEASYMQPLWFVHDKFNSSQCSEGHHMFLQNGIAITWMSSDLVHILYTIINQYFNFWCSFPKSLCVSVFLNFYKQVDCL